ncbi:MAG: leucine-rich repeat protein, partial [Clostridia bacterium]|nr:leucine-rich repeat protein [Clostridia bacterium]
MDVKRLLAVMLVLVLSVMQISPAGAYTLTMPSSLVTVEESAFEGDTSLDAISFTEGFETIGPRAFAYSSVKDLSLPSTFIRLADEAFLGNQGLSDLYLPDGIQFIGTRAFAYSSLESIYLPPSLNLIADDAFEGIIDLAVYASYDTYAYEWGVTHGYITPSNTDLDYEFEAIDEYTTKVVAYHGNDLDILFPTSDPYGRVVTVIGERVFSSQEVHNIVIPSSVHTIEDYAFCDAIGLETIEIPNSVTEIGQDAISNAEVTCRLNSTAYEYAYRNALRVNLIGNYTITGLERENNTFSAILSVTDPCNLFVRIFEDNDIDLIIEQVV